MSGWVSPTGWNINLASPGPIGGTTPSSGAFTTLNASSTVSGTGFSDYLASPPAIGGTAAAAGSFTTLNASSNVTLSGGTANGVVYLNGSKVATSDANITFDGTQLQVNGDIQVTGNRSIAFKNTGTATGTLAFEDSTGTQKSAIASYYNVIDEGNIEFINATATNMILRSSGNLGIGTTNPSEKLEVNGNAIISGFVTTIGYTVATLPPVVPIGSRAYVTDALTPTSLTIVVGGGAVVVPVFYNGTNWIVG